MTRLCWSPSAHGAPIPREGVAREGADREGHPEGAQRHPSEEGPRRHRGPEGPQGPRGPAHRAVRWLHAHGGAPPVVREGQRQRPHDRCDGAEGGHLHAPDRLVRSRAVHGGERAAFHREIPSPGVARARRGVGRRSARGERGRLADLVPHRAGLIHRPGPPLRRGATADLRWGCESVCVEYVRRSCGAGWRWQIWPKPNLIRQRPLASYQIWDGVCAIW